MNKILIVLTFILLIAAGWIGWLRISEQDDQRLFQEMQIQLQTESEEIALLEGELVAQAQNLNNIEASLSIIQNDIDFVENAHPDGIPEDLYHDYEQQVTRFNNLVATYNDTLSSYNRIYAGYQDRVGEYNRLVMAANELAGSLGTTWSVGQWAQYVGEFE